MKNILLFIFLGLCIYILSSYLYGEYLFRNKLILGYIGDFSLNNGNFYITGNNSINGINLYSVYSQFSGLGIDINKNNSIWNVGDGASKYIKYTTDKGELELRFYDSFEYVDVSSLDDGDLIFNGILDNVKFNDEYLMEISQSTTYTEKNHFNHSFNDQLLFYTNIFGKPNLDVNLGNQKYYWSHLNELLILYKYSLNSKYYINTSLIDRRMMKTNGYPLVILNKKRSLLLFYSRIGFFKRVWYIQ